ncbi:Ig-like domain repeat protein [Methanobrevibacter sp.]
MNIKRIMLISLLLVILTVGAVNAAEDNATDEMLTVEENTVELDSTDEIIAAQDDFDAVSDAGEEKLTANRDCEEIIQATDPDSYLTINGTWVGGNGTLNVTTHTFDELQTLIDDEVSDTLTLDNDYVSNGTPIVIDKAFTIDGNGHTLDARGLGGIFYISSDDVTLLNLNMVNANTNGSAITIEGKNCNIINCTLTNFTAIIDGGAILWMGENGLIANTSFINCTSNRYGGAVYFKGNGNMTNCSFIANLGSHGGAVYFNGNGEVTGCKFINNAATDEGGAVYFLREGIVSDCIFTDNTATNYGGAVYIDSVGTVSNCIFTNNLAENGGAIYFTDGGEVEFCIFNDNIATLGGAIYNGDFENCTIEGNGSQIYPVTETSIYLRINNDTLINENDTFIAHVGDELDLQIDISANEGNLTVIVSNITYNITIINNTGHFLLPALGAGNHSVIIIYGGSWKYSEKNITFTLEVDKITPEMILNALNIQVGENATVMVLLPEGAEGMVNFVVYDMYGSHVFEATSMVSDGKSLMAIPNLIKGFYEVEAIYSGDMKYNSLTSTIGFRVETRSLSINVTHVGDVIYIDAPGDIENNVTVIFAGMNYSLGPNGTINVSDFTPATYALTCTYPGDGKYSSYSQISTITIPKYELVVNTVIDTEEGFISITTPVDFTDTITLTLNGNNYLLASGERFDLTGFAPANYTYTISAMGDEKYLPYSQEGNITLTKSNINITTTVNNVEYGQNENFTVYLPVNATGHVVFILLDENGTIIDNTSSTIDNGEAIYHISSLNVGKYTLQSSYGSSKFYDVLSTSSFYVSPKISITPDVIIGDDGVITMELGNVSGNIKVFVNSEEDGSKRIIAGRFVYNLPTWALLPGNHSVYFEYTGDSFDKNVFNYWDDTAGSYKPINYWFIIHSKESSPVTESNNEVIKATLVDNNGNVLVNATGEVEFTIIDQFTGEVITRVVEVKNGIATLDISTFKNGNYVISWHYKGDERHTPISKSITLTISHKVSRIGAGHYTLLYTSTKAYQVTVYGASGRGLSGVPVTFYINGKAVKTISTNPNGVAGIVISKLPGSYKITVKSSGVEVTKKLTVKKILTLKKVNVKRSAKKLILTASLKKVDGKYLKGKKITFKFNGKKYTAKTNKKGVAKVTVKKNVLKKLKKGKKVKIQATYLKSAVKTTAKVK